MTSGNFKLTSFILILCGLQFSACNLLGGSSYVEDGFMQTATGGGATASLAFAPTLKAFGNVTVGANSTQSFTLSNSGVVGATSVFVAITGTGYSLANNNCGITGARVTVAAGGNCTFDVVFSPATTGATSGTVSLSYHDGAATQTTPSVNLSGTGTGGNLWDSGVWDTATWGA